MEVCPQTCDPAKWIFYNNEFGNYELNNKNEVVFGGESAGESVGWLMWWIVKRNLIYTNNVDRLLDTIVTYIT